MPFLTLTKPWEFEKVETVDKENRDAHSGLQGAFERSAIRGPGEG